VRQHEEAHQPPPESECIPVAVAGEKDILFLTVFYVGDIFQTDDTLTSFVFLQNLEIEVLLPVNRG